MTFSIFILFVFLLVVYIRATFIEHKKTKEFETTMLDNKNTIKSIQWIDELSNLELGVFFYPTQEVSLEFHSFNATKTSKNEYSIFSLNIDTRKYSFECIQILLDKESIIYSFVENSFDVRIDLILNSSRDRSMIKEKTNNCLNKL